MEIYFQFGYKKSNLNDYSIVIVNWYCEELSNFTKNVT